MTGFSLLGAGEGPANRIDGYADLRAYAAIGDGRTVALIALDGSIDWFPAPTLPTPPAFAAIVDAPHGGRIELRPVDDYTVTRRYVSGTNVLQTTFTTAAGRVRVTDALVTGVAGRLPWAELARRVDGLKGAVALRWSVAPGTMLGTAAPWVEHTVQGAVIRVDGVMLGVRGIDHGPSAAEAQGIAGAFTTSEGSRHLVVVTATEREPLHMITPEIVDRGVDRTIANWKAWSTE